MNSDWGSDGGRDERRRPDGGEVEGHMGRRFDDAASKVADAKASHALDDTSLAALDGLFAAARQAEVDPAAQDAAVAAFREARNSGAYGRTRTRRRDDWRSRPVSRRLAWRAALGTLLAGLTLGGVAFAVNGGPSDTPPATPATSPATPDRKSGQGQDRTPDGPKASRDPNEAPASKNPGGPKTSGHPGSEQSKEALCRRFEEVRDKGGEEALDSASRQRLMEEAGAHGQDVYTYCEPILTDAQQGAPAQTPGAKGDKRNAEPGSDRSAHGSQRNGN